MCSLSTFQGENKEADSQSVTLLARTQTQQTSRVFVVSATKENNEAYIVLPTSFETFRSKTFQFSYNSKSRWDTIIIQQLDSFSKIWNEKKTNSWKLINLNMFKFHSQFLLDTKVNPMMPMIPKRKTQFNSLVHNWTYWGELIHCLIPTTFKGVE